MRFDLPKTIVVMGVSGAGKTEVGRAVAALVGGLFEDADDFHSEEAKAKMGRGLALTDEDRWPWLERLRRRIEEVRTRGQVYVLACSALRAVYRERLRGADGLEGVRFVLLDGGQALIAERMGRRQGHYMPLSLLESQLAILERTEDLLEVSIEPAVEVIAELVVQQLRGEVGHE
jgi:gluconokinase